MPAGMKKRSNESLRGSLRIGHFQKARALIHTLAQILPTNDPEISDYLTSALVRSKHYKDAVRQATHTLSLIPDSVEARFNLARCLGSAGDPVQAERYIRDVIALRPERIGPRIDQAVYIAMQGRYDEAKKILESLLTRIDESNPNFDFVRFNLGWYLIRDGQFKKGIAYLEIGRRLGVWAAPAPQCSMPRLQDQEDVNNKNIMIVGEGGYGDEMLNVRFADVLTRRGARVIWAAKAELQSLFGRCRGIHEVIAFQQISMTLCDFWTPAIDLPRILGLDSDDLQCAPYLTSDASYSDKWRSIIKQKPGRLRVGIRWQGNPLCVGDVMRTVSFSALSSLTEIPHVDFYSLQRDAGAEQVRPESGVVDLANLLATWDDTAAAIAQLDLVISSCTSVAHLAAGMGKLVWVLCPIKPYYVWACPGSTSPWYESVRLYRQVKHQCWKEPLSLVRDELSKLAGAVSSQRRELS